MKTKLLAAIAVVVGFQFALSPAHAASSIGLGSFDFSFENWLPNPGAFPGVSIGNGGLSFACAKDGGGIISIEAFDLWESRIMEGYDFPTDDQVGDPVQFAINLAAKADAAQGHYDEGPKVHAQRLTLAERVKFIAENMRFTPRGVGLGGTGDTGKQILKFPKNCGLIQTINFRDSKRILVNGDVWDKLSAGSQAALLLHEAIYWFLRESRYDDDDTRIEPDSRRTRNAVGYMMSGGDLSPVTDLDPNQKNVQYCRDLGGQSLGDYPTKLFAYRNAKGNMVIQLIQVGGYRMLTKTRMIFAPLWGGQNDPVLKTGLHQRYSTVARTDSPIDVDATFKILFGQSVITIGGALEDGVSAYGSLKCTQIQ